VTPQEAETKRGLRLGILVGGALTLAAGGLTAIYLALITIDDGLEALMFIPILGAMFAIAGGFGGWRGRTILWSLGLSLGLLIVAFTAEVIWWIWVLTHWRGDTGADASGMLAPAEVFSITVLAGVSTLGTLTGLTFVFSAVGWLVGLGARKRMLRKRPPPPSAPVVTTQA
jgi:hypothetical protein